MPTTRPLYVFIDESGNFDFSDSGTDHFVMSAVWTANPERTGRDLVRLRYEFMTTDAHDQVPFHATNNSAGTRKRVIDVLADREDFWVHTLWADKHYAHRSIREPERFYGIFGKALGRYLMTAIRAEFEPIVMVFDAALSAKQRGAFLKTVKPALATMGRPYKILFKPVKEDVNGQIADYYAWAKFRELESQDDSWIKRLPARTSEFNLFRNGYTRWY
ncbi:DUF3800 domain-containing protein [Curtobacterium sp. 24E2]|nr:DUF3800 domain-containing protein [Curtobacterium sp. 24E2]